MSNAEFVRDESAVAAFLAGIREVQQKYNIGIGSESTEKFLALLADREAKLSAVRELRDLWNKQPGRESFAPTFSEELNEALGESRG